MLIAHGGGPTPVINNSLLGVLETAGACDAIGTVYGARFGVEGILQDDLADLSAGEAQRLRRLSGTPASVIGSCRRKLSESDYPRILECLEKHDIGYFLYNGGNDSMDTCHRIHQLAVRSGYALRVIGIPKTIDNDLMHTDHSPGYGSAARYAAVSAAELAMDTASLPIHVIIMELMGRNAGWITASATLFKDAMPCEQLVYLPEQPLNRQRFLADIAAAYDKRHGLLVVVSEGLKDEEGIAIGDTGLKDGFGHIIPGGTAQYLADLILTQTNLRARAEKPGLLGRTSMAYLSPVDSDEAYRAGAFAVESAAQGESGYMVSIEADRSPAYVSRMRLVPLESVANAEKSFPPEWICSKERSIATQFKEYCLPLLGTQKPDYYPVLF